MKLETARRRHKGQWIAFRATDKGENPEGEVLLHNTSRGDFDRELLKRRPMGVYITFAGPPIPKGYSTLF